MYLQFQGALVFSTKYNADIFLIAGLTYHGRAADTWAVGVTLYCMVLGNYPFLGDTLQDTYDKVSGFLLLLLGNIIVIVIYLSTSSYLFLVIFVFFYFY